VNVLIVEREHEVIAVADALGRSIEQRDRRTRRRRHAERVTEDAVHVE
jgi:hypothetical protein